MREAASVVLIQALVEAGAKVCAYDPVASLVSAGSFPITWLALVAEWSCFAQPDLAAMNALMRTPVLFDGRNQYDPRRLTEHGFRYFGIGRGSASLPDMTGRWKKEG